MTPGSITSFAASKATRAISVPWFTIAISALGPIMTAGRVPVEVTVRALRFGRDRLAS